MIDTVEKQKIHVKRAKFSLNYIGAVPSSSQQCEDTMYDSQHPEQIDTEKSRISFVF